MNVIFLVLLATARARDASVLFSLSSYFTNGKIATVQGIDTFPVFYADRSVLNTSTAANCTSNQELAVCWVWFSEGSDLVTAYVDFNYWAPGYGSAIYVCKNEYWKVEIHDSYENEMLYYALSTPVYCPPPGLGIPDPAPLFISLDYLVYDSPIGDNYTLTLNVSTYTNAVEKNSTTERMFVFDENGRIECVKLSDVAYLIVTTQSVPYLLFGSPELLSPAIIEIQNIPIIGGSGIIYYFGETGHNYAAVSITPGSFSGDCERSIVLTLAADPSPYNVQWLSTKFTLLLFPSPVSSYSPYPKDSICRLMTTINNQRCGIVNSNNVVVLRCNITAEEADPVFVHVPQSTEEQDGFVHFWFWPTGNETSCFWAPNDMSNIDSCASSGSILSLWQTDPGVIMASFQFDLFVHVGLRVDDTDDYYITMENVRDGAITWDLELCSVLPTRSPTPHPTPTPMVTFTFKSAHGTCGKSNRIYLADFDDATPETTKLQIEKPDKDLLGYVQICIPTKYTTQEEKMLWASTLCGGMIMNNCRSKDYKWDTETNQFQLSVWLKPTADLSSCASGEAFKEERGDDNDVQWYFSGFTNNLSNYTTPFLQSRALCSVGVMAVTGGFDSGQLNSIAFEALHGGYIALDGGFEVLHEGIEKYVDKPPNSQTTGTIDVDDCSQYGSFNWAIIAVTNESVDCGTDPEFTVEGFPISGDDVPPDGLADPYPSSDTSINPRCEQQRYQKSAILGDIPTTQAPTTQAPTVQGVDWWQFAGAGL